MHVNQTEQHTAEKMALRAFNRYLDYFLMQQQYYVAIREHNSCFLGKQSIISCEVVVHTTHAGFRVHSFVSSCVLCLNSYLY